MNICVLGMGYVGLTTSGYFAELGYNVTGIDISPEKIYCLNQKKVPFYEPGLQDLVIKNIESRNLVFINDIKRGIEKADIIFIAVGTPISFDGNVDTSQLDSVIKFIGKYINGYKIIVTKSTVPIGTNRRIISTIKSLMSIPYEFDVVSNPEFLREGSAVYDMFHMDRIILGSNSENAIEVIKSLYKTTDTKYLISDFETAELIKYASNAFLATKISFINEIANLCDALTIDVSKVSEGMGMDKRIGSEFLKAGVGYGGSCFHKDINALIKVAEECKVSIEIAATVEKVNNNQRIRIVEKVKELCGNNLNSKTATILGVSFKPNTDDIRNSPAIDVIELLQQEGMEIKVYDPVVSPHDLESKLSFVNFQNNIYEALTDTDIAIILTEWNEIKEIDWEKAKNIMKHHAIIDGRNIYDSQIIKGLGFYYKGIGRS